MSNVKTNSKWEPNEKQKAFMELLKNNPDGLTLASASKILGYDLKSGTTNPLISKGLIVGENIEIKCNLVAIDTNEIVGHANKPVKRYKLAEPTENTED